MRSDSPPQPLQPLRLALVGNPNCGKTALFNRLTGARQKVANYAGVTVERKEGQFTSSSGRHYRVIDLPGTYSLNALSPDEAVTRDVLLGTQSGETPPDVIVLVADATNLRLNLRLVLEVLRLKRPAVLALNMMDVARKSGLVLDVPRLRQELGIPVIEAVAIEPNGGDALISQLETMTAGGPTDVPSGIATEFHAHNTSSLEATQNAVRRILASVIKKEGDTKSMGDRIDAFV
ncbi:MAG TPA: FeoB small GTPase domain-containing protein, partial [Burkholderiaceae bacterium]